MKKRIISEASIFKFLKGFITNDPGDVKTIETLSKAMKEPMPGHEDVTKGEYFNDLMRKKGIRIK